MKIYLSKSTVGRYGGGLNLNLNFFDRFIQSELDKSGFKSSFEELWLTIAYPPLYILPGIVGMEMDFYKNYETFPYSRLNRRYKKINVTLKAPQFSEHFDKADQVKYEHKFDIEDKYKNISDVELAKILIDKYLEAAEIINSKLKKEDYFDFDTLKNTLLSIKEKITLDLLKSINSEQTVQISDNTIKLAIERREKRKMNDEPKDKIIRDLRVYYNELPVKALYPYDYQYVEIFLNYLRKKRLKCPTYHHIYIQVAKSIDMALKSTYTLEDWYVYGISIIDYDKYLQQSEKEKEETVFNVIVNGLKDVADIDKLDYSIIQEVVLEIKEKGLDSELEFKTIENNNYKLRITYFSKSLEEENPIFINLTEKSTGKTIKKEIGRINNFDLYLWLQKITLTNKQIRIKSSDSIRASVWLKDKTRSMEFEIKDLLK